MQIIRSPVFKIVICFCLAFTLFFAQPKEKMPEAEAVLPAILLSVLGSVVLDIAIDMGIDFIDKNAGKKWADNIVGKLWNKYGSIIQDLKPTKTNAGKWTLKLGKGLLTAITAEIAASSLQTKEKSDERETGKAPYLEVDSYNKYVGNKSYVKEITGTTDPFYNTNINVSVTPYNSTSANQAAYAFLLKYGTVELKPIAYEQKTEMRVCIGNSCTNTQSVNGGNYVIVSPNSYSTSGINLLINDRGYQFVKGDTGTRSMSPTWIGSNYYPLFETYKKQLSEANKVIYEFDGAIVTDGFESYLTLLDVSPDVLDKLDPSKLPPALQEDREFEFDISDPTAIDAEYEIINEGDEFEWDIVEQDIVNQGDTIYYDVDNIYSPTINNYYTVTPEQKEEIENDITIIINNPPAENGGTGEGSTDGFMYCVDKPGAMVVSCKDIEAVDGSILTYIKNSYDYAVNAVKTGSDGLKTIVEGSAGLIALYSNIFDWLPDEVTILLTSGLLLMIGLRVFRR